MASTQIELARRAHEEIERLERAATRALKDNAPTTHRARLEQNRLVDEVLRASVERAKRLVRVCARAGGFRVKRDAMVFSGGGYRIVTMRACVDGTRRVAGMNEWIARA